MLHQQNHDSRGRVRFTYGGNRYEINKYGILRSYKRNTVFPGSERAQLVNVLSLDAEGRHTLQDAITKARGF